MKSAMRPTHPVEIYAKDWLSLALSTYTLAVAVGGPANRITGIIKEQRTTTADTALRLARYFGMSPELWMNLQIAYELRKTDAQIGKQIERTIRPRAA